MAGKLGTPRVLRYRPELARRRPKRSEVACRKAGTPQFVRICAVDHPKVNQAS